MLGRNSKMQTCKGFYVLLSFHKTFYFFLFIEFYISVAPKTVKILCCLIMAALEAKSYFRSILKFLCNFLHTRLETIEVLNRVLFPGNSLGVSISNLWVRFCSIAFFLFYLTGLGKPSMGQNLYPASHGKWWHCLETIFPRLNAPIQQSHRESCRGVL